MGFQMSEIEFETLSQIFLFLIMMPPLSVFVGWSPSLGRSPSNYNFFYCVLIWLSKILTGQEFDSQISLPVLNLKLKLHSKADHLLILVYFFVILLFAGGTLSMQNVLKRGKGGEK